MTEKRRGLDHALMKPLLPDFQVRAAGERHFHAHEDFIVRERRNVNALDFQIFGAVQDGCRHMPIAFAIDSHSCRITTFKVSPAGRAANSSASPIWSSEKRCEINSRTGSLRSKTKPADWS